MKERRAAPRVAISADVTFGSGDNFFTGRSRDISLGGLFLSVDPAGPNIDGMLRSGSQITLKLKLLDDTFQISCEVMWELVDDDGRISGVGVRFVELTTAMREAIESFMAFRAPFRFEVGDSQPPARPPPIPR